MEANMNISILNIDYKMKFEGKYMYATSHFFALVGLSTLLIIWQLHYSQPSLPSVSRKRKKQWLGQLFQSARCDCAKKFIQPSTANSWRCYIFVISTL